MNGLHGRSIGVLGLSFKPNTDDTHDAPALDIIRLLINAGSKVQVFDSQAIKVNRGKISKPKLCQSLYAASEGAAALILATEWNQFKSLNF